MRQRRLIQDIAQTCDAYHRCVKENNTLWRDNYYETLKHFARNELPRGSGIDCGTKIDIDRSTGNRVVLTTSFHHMDENGYYDGWTEHTIYITPSFDGIDLRITGSNRNQIKDYLYDCYYWCLQQIRQPDGMYCDNDLYSRYRDEALNRVADLHVNY